MRPLSAILLVLFTNLVVSAQTDSPTPQKCPTLDATLSPSLVNVGEILTATAVLTDADIKDLKFKWFINGGIILEGQGKSEILAQQLPEHAGESLTVTVTVEGFANGCPAISDSATTDIAKKPVAISFERYGKLNVNAEKARLDNFVINLQQDSISQGLILVSFDKQSGNKYRQSKIQRVFDYLTVKRKLEANRILFAVTENDYEETILLIVPPGAEPPYSPEQYKLIKVTDLTGKRLKSKPKRRKRK